jgi:hypothetical protein
MAGTFEEDIVNRAANLRSHGEEEMYTREMIKVSPLYLPWRLVQSLTGPAKDCSSAGRRRRGGVGA